MADVSKPNSPLRDSRQATWLSSFKASLWTRLESFVIAAAWAPDGAHSLVARGGSFALASRGLTRRYPGTFVVVPSGVGCSSPPGEAKKPPFQDPPPAVSLGFFLAGLSSRAFLVHLGALCVLRIRVGLAHGHVCLSPQTVVSALPTLHT